MKNVKFSTNIRTEYFPVERDVFEEQTGLKYPFQQFLKSDNKYRQFAICPHCENPVQLIGMYSEKSKMAPYGKHAGKNVDGFQQYNVNRYLYCPYASHKRAIKQNERLEIPDEKTAELYMILRNNFDRVVHIIKKVLGIKISLYLAEDALTSYRENQSYLYPWTSLANLPWMLCYFGLNQRNLYAQKIKLGSPLFQAIKDSCSGVVFEPDKSDAAFGRLYFEKGHYHRLQMRFLRHNQIAKKGEPLLETIDFFVDRFRDSSTYEHDEIYFETIEIDQTFFYNLTHKENNEKYRDHKLLEISDRILKPLN